MKDGLLEILVCPHCETELQPTDSKKENGMIVTGQLDCPQCARSFPIINGVPTFYMTEEMSNIAESFGFQWEHYYEEQYEKDTLYGRTREQDLKYFLSSLRITEADIKGKRILDAGCGSGKLTRIIGELGGEVVGVDVSKAAFYAYKYCSDLPNVSIVQADIFNLPFRMESFDYIWSNGVIHHTPDPKLAHRQLSSLVKPGGAMYIWVYAKRFTPFGFTKRTFESLGILRLFSLGGLNTFCKIISVPSWMLLQVYRGVRWLPGLRPRTVWGANTTRPRSLGDLRLCWFDALSPEHDSEHSEEEVVGWFRDHGFTEIWSNNYMEKLPKGYNHSQWIGGATGIGVKGIRGKVPA